MSRTRVIRGGAGVSLRLDMRTAAVTVAASALATVLAVIAMGVGDFPISPREVIATLLGEGTARQEFIVIELRMPRVLLALLVGAAFALSGAIFQSLARNPLVAPDIIGVNAGAAAVAVGIIILGLPTAALAPGAFAGALGAALLVYVLAHRRGLSTMRLVLVGIAVNALLTAVISFLLTRGEINDVQRATVWLIGSLYAADWADVRVLTVVVLVLGPAAVALGRRLEVLQLGDDLARGLGAPVQGTRMCLVVVGVGLAAVGVAVAGPIGFVAFIAPHIARRLARSTATGTLVAAMAVGALLLLASDVVAQRLFAPTALPVGVVTAMLGAPYFLYLLRRAGRSGAAL